MWVSNSRTRPIIILLVGDHTGNTEFTLQPRELKQLTGYSEEALLKDCEIVYFLLNLATYFLQLLRII